MAIVTGTAVLTLVLVARHLRRRNRERARHAAVRGHRVEELDPSVVSATIVLTTLPNSVMEQTLEMLPPEMARAIVLVLPELPPIAQTTVERERHRWLTHFSPPREDFRDIESEEPRRLAAATVRLVLEDMT